MEYNKIRELLAHYWEGETSLEEEGGLRDFFATAPAGLPADLETARPLFAYFNAATERTVPAMEIPFPSLNGQESGIHKIRPLQHWMKYAAILLIALGIGYGARQYHARQERIAFVAAQQDTYDDPEKAFAATKRALQLIARNLNKGTSQMQKLAYFTEATDKIKAD